MVTRHVRNVTPRTRTEGFVDALGLVAMAIGWLFVAFAGMQALGVVLTVVIGLILIAVGRKLRV